MSENDAREGSDIIRRNGIDIREPENAIRGLGNIIRGTENDIREAGIDVRSVGNDIRECGIDIRKPGNGIRKAGIDIREPGDDVRRMRIARQNAFVILRSIIFDAQTKNGMKLTEVKSAAEANLFLRVNVLMNAGDPNYIRPLDVEINEVFDKTKNKSFRFGEAARWILRDDGGKPIGRIAAFTNSKYVNKGTEYPVGGVGFFDCIDNQEAANTLFDAAKNWLQGKGMEAMDGPINFGDRDKWWGLMVEGRERPPVYGMAYNPPYYQHLMETYGFQNYYNQYYFARGVNDPLSSKFPERYEKFKAKKDYSARHISIKNLDKHAQDFATVYNAAWAQHGEAKEITKEQALQLFKKMKLVMDERIIWFAYYKEEPIAMWINIPDLNEYFKHFNGKLGWLEKLRLLWMKRRGECRIFTGVAFGVVPKYQALGVDSFMIQEGGYALQHKGWYDTYEMGWSGDWNPKMINIYKSLGASQSRWLITYRFVFDEAKHLFERHPVMEYKV